MRRALLRAGEVTCAVDLLLSFGQIANFYVLICGFCANFIKIAVKMSLIIVRRAVSTWKPPFFTEIRTFLVAIFNGTDLFLEIRTIFALISLAVRNRPAAWALHRGFDAPNFAVARSNMPNRDPSPFELGFSPQVRIPHQSMD